MLPQPHLTAVTEAGSRDSASEAGRSGLGQEKQGLGNGQEEEETSWEAPMEGLALWLHQVYHAYICMHQVHPNISNICLQYIEYMLAYICMHQVHPNISNYMFLSPLLPLTLDTCAHG